ncbi:MAG: RNA 3'-terminal phosphate cyclase [Candidatus Aenigmarchaeota archaeon]|nr:RNA 3'-terminal phosphate cyclase [Candidatus Aenigmarchaeota archaeon]
MLEIDGGPGGGAVLRVASALAAITGTPIQVTHIRQSRPNPGLQAQHLEGLKAVADLCGGQLEGARLGSTVITLTPGPLKKKRLDVRIGTAGSVGLVFQSLGLPAAVAGASIQVRGGATFGKWAPPLVATQTVLLAVLQKMGFQADISIRRHGFYPAGGSEVEITVPACTLSPLSLTSRGVITHIGGLSVASSGLRSAQVAERQAVEAERLLKRRGYRPLIKSQYVEADNPGSGIVLWAGTGGGAIVGADALGERGKPAQDVGSEAALSLLRTITSGACVDDHLSDQLLAFMAMAPPSAITVPTLTAHAKTNMELIERFLPVHFSAKEQGSAVLISVASRS